MKPTTRFEEELNRQGGRNKANGAVRVSRVVATRRDAAGAEGRYQTVVGLKRKRETGLAVTYMEEGNRGWKDDPKPRLGAHSRIESGMHIHDTIQPIPSLREILRKKGMGRGRVKITNTLKYTSLSRALNGWTRPSRCL